jgi:hypothetical protein
MVEKRELEPSAGAPAPKRSRFGPPVGEAKAADGAAAPAGDSGVQQPAVGTAAPKVGLSLDAIAKAKEALRKQKELQEKMRKLKEVGQEGRSGRCQAAAIPLQPAASPTPPFPQAAAARAAAAAGGAPPATATAAAAAAAPAALGPLPPPPARPAGGLPPPSFQQQEQQGDEGGSSFFDPAIGRRGIGRLQRRYCGELGRCRTCTCTRQEAWGQLQRERGGAPMAAAPWHLLLLWGLCLEGATSG